MGLSDHREHQGLPRRVFLTWVLQKSVPAEEAHFINTKQLKFLLARSRWQVSQGPAWGHGEEGLTEGVAGVSTHRPGDQETRPGSLAVRHVWPSRAGKQGLGVLPLVCVLPELTGWVGLCGTCYVPARREHNDRALGCRSEDGA